jgi:uncharacterized membrane protein
MPDEYDRKTIAARLLQAGLKRISRHERNRLALLLRRSRIARDVQSEFEKNLTFGQRLADRVAEFGGSWTFILLFAAVLLLWVAFNTFVFASQAFDPYPYIFLNLLLSMIAAIQAPVIMMSQNRQAMKDRLAAQHDYEINLKAEIEVIALHDKLDALRTGQLAEIAALQQKQIELLAGLVSRSAEANRDTTPGL